MRWSRCPRTRGSLSEGDWSEGPPSPSRLARGRLRLPGWCKPASCYKMRAMPVPKQSSRPDRSEGSARQPSAKLDAPRMATPARADRMTVEELLKLAREGRLRVPSFQRGLRWDASDKWKLLDSMERGYPIGTLLLWKRAASTSDIGSPLPSGTPAPAQGDLYLVVDGQQRITTLWEALALAPEARRPTIVFDMVKEEFVVRALKKHERGPVGLMGQGASPPALPMHIALDAVTLSEWVPTSLPRETKLRYYEVGKRLREYLVPIYVVEGDNIDALRHVFDRTNSTGKPLTRDEVFDALVGSRIDSNGERGLGLVHDQLRDLRFGSIARSTILKVFEAIRGEKIGKLDPRGLDPGVAEADLLGAARALRKAVKFLQSIGVPHVAVLPYELPLVVMARLFHLHQTPDEKSLILLKRWFWRGAAAERHSGSSGSLQQHVDDVAPRDEQGSVQRLLERTGEPRVPDLKTIARDEISIASARGKIILCALFSHAPRDLLSGEKIVPDELFGDGTHEVTLRIVQPGMSELGSTIANRLLHPDVDVMPSRLIRECNDEGALASHGMNRSSQEALRHGEQADVDGFLKARGDVLGEWITHFIREQAEWERPDNPSMRALSQRKRVS